MWTVIFTKDRKIEHKETFERYFHAQMLADNLILGVDSHFGAANLPDFKSGEAYRKNEISIEIIGQNKVEEDSGDFVFWLKNRNQMNDWSSF
jgi:hypothetical protein